MIGTKGSMKQVLNLKGKKVEREVDCFNELVNGMFIKTKKAEMILN